STLQGWLGSFQGVELQGPLFLDGDRYRLAPHQLGVFQLNVHKSLLGIVKLCGITDEESMGLPFGDRPFTRQTVEKIIANKKQHPHHRTARWIWEHFVTHYIILPAL